MARPLRIEFAGAVHHVTSRGNGRADIFRDDRDRLRFLSILADVIEQHGWRCHAYCLMTNHYHLLIETPEPNLSRGMAQLNGRYAQWFCHRHVTSGHLFQGRFWSIVVEKDTHLLELARYVVLNPVRGGIVRGPEDWPWSSHRAAIGLDPAPPWLQLEELLGMFGSTQGSAAESYARFVADGGESPWPRVTSGCVLGGEAFAARCRAVLAAREAPGKAPPAARELARPPLSELLAGYDAAGHDAQNRLVERAHRDFGYGLGEIARALGVHRTTIFRRAKAGQPG